VLIFTWYGLEQADLLSILEFLLKALDHEVLAVLVPQVLLGELLDPLII